MTIYLDFDGTMVLHRFPDIGEEVPGAVQTVKELIAAGHEVVLNTWRTEINSTLMSDVVTWLKTRGVENISCLEHKRHVPNFGNFAKDYYIDDQPIDAPLLASGAVDWSVVREHFGLKQIDEKN